MALRFLGSDPDSPNGGSPSLWDDGDAYVLQRLARIRPGCDCRTAKDGWEGLYPRT